MTLSRLFVLLLVTSAGIAAAQADTEPAPIENKACGFRIALPEHWKVTPSGHKSCVFTITSPAPSDGKVQLSLRDGTPEDGEKDLGFSQENGRWMLHSVETVNAEGINSSTWSGLQGTVTTKAADNTPGSVPLQETRALLVSHNNRIAEITGEKENVVEGLAERFDFLPPSTP
ncbi:MAG TPA: hypothetical protein VMG31_01755 [Verrucomicrobiae bacterium]|nr:hypothetical protein [Verrucomicrobiae bacterium]